MEAVAAVASIAGIITLVGQSIDGLIRFREFFSDISSASKTVSRLLADVNSLIQILRNVGDVLHRVEARRNDQNFASLDIKLEDCTKDVKIWLETAKALRPGSETGGRALMKKFRLAVKNEAVVKIREEIGRHRQALCLSLAVFGRSAMSFSFRSPAFLSLARFGVRLIRNVGPLIFTHQSRSIRCVVDSMML